MGNGQAHGYITDIKQRKRNTFRLRAEMGNYHLRILKKLGKCHCIPGNMYPVDDSVKFGIIFYD